MNRFQVKGPTGITLSMMLLYLVQWGAQYVGYNYLPLYIDSLPFSTNSTVGLAIAVGSATTILVQPFWGRMADRAKTKNRILIIALVLEGVMGLLFFQKLPNLWVLLLCIILFYIPFLAPQSLIDTIVVENMGKVKVRFGMIRCFASGGAATMAFIFGAITDLNDIKAFSIFLACAFGSLIPLLMLPKTKGHARAAGQKISYKKLLQNKKFLLFLFYGFCLFLCSTMVNPFFPIFVMTEQGLNSGTEWYGIFMGITILLEMLIMFFGAKLFARLPHYLVFMIPPVVGIFRMLFLVLAQAPSDLYIYPIFHAMWFAPLWCKVAPFIQEVVPEEMRATGQSIWTIITCGIAPVIGSLTSGFLSDLFGIRQTFGVIMGMLIIMSVVFAFLFLRQSRKDKQAEEEERQHLETGETAEEFSAEPVEAEVGV